jgi:putative membrane protein
MNILSHKLIATTVAATFALCGAAAHAQSAPDDAQIAGIVVAANSVDIDAGKLAQKKTKNKEVKDFARQMVTDHTGVNQQAVALVTKLKVTPQESELSKSLKQGGSDNLAKLKGLKGKAFDKAYVAHEVVYHQAVIDALDKTLIPNARNAELKDTLVKVRPAFVAHLEHARHLEAALN